MPATNVTHWAPSADLPPMKVGDRPEAEQSMPILRPLVPGVLALLLGLTFHPSQISLQQGAVVFTVASLVAIYFALRMVPGRGLSLLSAYILLTVLFNGGLLIPIAFRQKIQLFGDYHREWIYSQATGAAALISALTILVMVSVHGVAFTIFRGLQSSQAQPVDRAVRGLGLGAALVLGGVLSWWWTALFTSNSIFSTSYQEWNAETGGGFLPYAYLMIGVGMGLLGASRQRGELMVALTAFVIFALPAFGLGIRGPVIISSACFAISRARSKGVKLSWWWLLILTALMGLGAAVKEGRDTGIKSLLEGGLKNANPLYGFNELGYSIRPASVVWSDLQAGSEPTSWAVYWAPVNRFFFGTVLGNPVTPADEDMNGFNTYVAKSVGQIGGSPIAEALRAFEYPGLLIIPIILAVLIGILDGLPRTTWNDALVGGLSYPLLMWVRNDFTPVLFQAGVVIALLCLFKILGPVRPKT